MDADIDFLLSAKNLATRFRWSRAGESLHHDPEEIYSAALFVIGRLAVKYKHECGSWAAYVRDFGHWAMVSELYQSGYILDADDFKNCGQSITSS